MYTVGVEQWTGIGQERLADLDAMENKKASKSEWQVETLLDCGVYRVQCTLCVTHRQITVTPNELQ